MKLYEIDSQIEKLLDMQWEDGLFDEDIKDTLNSLLMEKRDKCVNIALFIKNLKKDIEKFKEEEDRLTKKRKSMENRMDWLKTYLSSSLDGEKIDDDPRVIVSYRKSETVIVDNQDVLPEIYLIPQDVKVDKAGIKDALKKGEKIEGAHLQENNNIIIK